MNINFTLSFSYPLIVFKLIDLSENILNYRKISIDVIWWSYSGLKVPNSALMKPKDYYYVIRNRAGYEEKILVKVLRQNEDYAIVENYSTQALEEAGYDTSSLSSKKSISVYDEILYKKK